MPRVAGRGKIAMLGLALYRDSKQWRFIRRCILILVLTTSWCSAHFAAYAQDAQVQQAQETLKALGYDVGQADGFIGPRTQAALRSYQASKGLNSTGTLDPSTLLALRGDTTSQAHVAPAPVAPSSDGGGGGFVWFLLIAGGTIWYFTAKGKAKKQLATTSVHTFDHAGGRRTESTTTVETSARKWALSGATGQAKLTEESQKCWVPLGQYVTVAGIIIAGGVYVGRSLHRQDGRDGENCLIDPSLKVSSNRSDSDGTHMPYWPSYSLVTPEARRAYLQWLAGGKDDPSTYIGYVFLYFYGLERRLMLDDAGDEAPALHAELQRLHSIYKDNHSFDRYATALLSVAPAKYQKLSSQWPALSLQKVSWELSPGLLVALGTTISQGAALDAFQMLAWYNAHPEKRLPPLAARCPEEFKGLFKARFDAKYPGGMSVNPPKRTLEASYKAASSTFNVKFKLGSTPIPDVSGLTAPLNAMDPIVEACAAELSTYARLIGKDRSARNEMAAAAALPTQLLKADAGAPIARLTSWLDSRVAGGAVPLPLRDLLAQVGAEPSDDGKTNKADLTLIADALSRCGFGLEPDPKIAYPSTPTAAEVIVFRADGGARLDEVSPEFLGALAQVDIGMMVATSDDKLVPAEVDFLASKIAGNPELSSSEKVRLTARIAFLAKYPPTTRIFLKFKDRSLPDREAVARLAISVAASDGEIAIEEMRTLEKLYKTLALEPARLYSDLQAHSIADDEPPVVAQGDTVRSVPIPSKPKPKPAQRAKTLDPHKLAKTRADTAIVSTILSEIFTDDDGLPGKAPIVTTPAQAVPATDAARTRFPGLDPKYVALLSAIAAHNSMDRGAFEMLSGSHNLMCDGAIEAINDWSYERFDGPILDDGPHIQINQEILSLAEGQVS